MSFLAADPSNVDIATTLRRKSSGSPELRVVKVDGRLRLKIDPWRIRTGEII